MSDIFASSSSSQELYTPLRSNEDGFPYRYIQQQTAAIDWGNEYDENTTPDGEATHNVMPLDLNANDVGFGPRRLYDVFSGVAVSYTHLTLPTIYSV